MKLFCSTPRNARDVINHTHCILQQACRLCQPQPKVEPHSTHWNKVGLDPHSAGIDLGRQNLTSNPANTRHSTNVGSKLGRRRRRRANIDPTLFQCLVFAGKDNPLPGMTGPPHLLFIYRIYFSVGPVTLTAILFPQPAVGRHSRCLPKTRMP